MESGESDEKKESTGLEMKINMNEDGSIYVTGPGVANNLYNEPVCFWLLDKAKDFIKAHNHQALKPNVILPHKRF